METIELKSPYTFLALYCIFGEKWNNVGYEKK